MKQSYREYAYSRFVFILLTPPEHPVEEILAIGRALGTLMVDTVFATIAYQSKHVNDLCAGVDEFLSQSLVIPAGRMPSDHRLEPQPTAVARRPGMFGPLATYEQTFSAAKEETIEEKTHNVPSDLKRTGRFCGGLIEDVKRKWKWYWSDYRDFFRADSFLQCLGATMFLFLANITKTITFAGLMEQLLDRNMVHFSSEL